MADMKVEGEALKKLVKMGKKRRLSFAFCPGQKNDHTVIIDRRKKPEVIAKVAKKEGGGAKIAFGTFVVNSKTMELTCERVVPAMAKVLKKYLKSQKVLVNVLIMDAQGNVLDSDVEDLPDDPAWEAEDVAEPGDDDGQDDAQDDGPAAAEPEASAPAFSAAQLAGRIKAIQPAIAAAPADAVAKLTKVIAMAVSQIKSGDLDNANKTITALEGAVAKVEQAAPDAQAEPAETSEPPAAPAPDVRTLAARANALKDVIADIGGPAAEKLTKALVAAVKQIKAADLAAADTVLGRIEDAVNKMATTPPASPAPSPQQAKWEAAESRLQPAVDKLMQQKRGDLAAINRFFNFAKEQAAAGGFDKALAAAVRVADLIKQAASQTTTAAAQEAEQATPDNVVAYTKTRLAWIETRGGLRKELEGLKSAIDKATAGIEGLQELPAKSGVLFDYLNDIDTDLEDTMGKLVEAPDGDLRETLKSSARKIIADYRDVLDTEFFKAVDNNGFVATSIRADALASLQQVSAALET